MKQFIKGIPPTMSHAFGGYVNHINIDHIVDIYKSLVGEKDKYNAIVAFGNHVETWEIQENDFKMLLGLEKNG